MIYDVTVVLDKSGSMSSIADDAVGGYNQFLKEQESGEGEVRVTLIEFDTAYEMVYESRPVAEAPRLSLAAGDDTHRYRPGGCTALLDAVGKAINEAEDRAAAKPDSRQLFVVLTDGQENSSREWSRKAVFEAVERHRKAGWNFLFLGANIDAFAEAGGIGIARRQTASFAATSGGTLAAIQASSDAVRRFRSSGGRAEALDFTPEEREAMREGGGGDRAGRDEEAG